MSRHFWRASSKGSLVRVRLSFALVCATAMVVQATVITVTNTNDSGTGSLRQALADAHDGDTITFAVTGTIGLSSGELVIDKSVTINGPGSDNVTVDGNHATRVFHVSGRVTVTISDLTIANGASDNGGGIYNDGGNGSATLTIIDSIITGNEAGGGIAAGGGIYSNGDGMLTIINSTISGNSAIGEFELAGAGGGIAGGGTILNSMIAENHAAIDGGGISGGGIITNCTIRNNSAGGGQNNRPGRGGGIEGGGTITNCTISGNSVFGNTFKGPGVGGGIYSTGATIVNSTLSDNGVAYGYGGAIYNPRPLSLENNTFSHNSATQGGGIYNIGNLGSITIGNTILDRRGAAGENIFNQGGTITSDGYNLSSDDGGGYLTGPGDQINTNPLLGLLQNNGGPTFTHALQPGSPAIDAGDPSFTPPPVYDQRGAPFVRVFNGRIDIGSFELQPTPTPTPTPRPTATPRPRPTPATRRTPRV